MLLRDLQWVNIMALDTRLPLVDVSADSAGALTQGANLGLGLRKSYEGAKDRETKRKRLGVEDAQNNAISVFSILGDTEITAENYGHRTPFPTGRMP